MIHVDGLIKRFKWCCQAADQMNVSVSTLATEATQLRGEVETFLQEIKAV